MPASDAVLLFTMGGADAGIHAEENTLWRTPAMHAPNPLARTTGKSETASSCREVFGLEAAPVSPTPHFLWRFCPHDRAHRRIVAQALCVVHVFVAGKMPKLDCRGNLT